MNISNSSKIFSTAVLICGGLTAQTVCLAASNVDSPWLTKLSPANATIVLQVGGFNATQGKEQNIGIDGLDGDRFTVTHDHDSNVLVGLGYYIDGFDSKKISLLYGINGYYFGHTSVQGEILQEQQYANLSYHYSLVNYPIYAAAKMLLKSAGDNYDITLDLGVGPNFILTSDYTEASLDGISTPDNLYSGQTSVAYSATAGVGIKFNHMIGSLPAELSYRFFYLGEGTLGKNPDVVQNSLKTGDNYANALMFSIYF
ncbi:MAG: hypothetical protein K5Q00_01155 [Gammaproteobacteria bacterium]|nr:hypothetical protein [Gammaproteobacteria bacterium]